MDWRAPSEKSGMRGYFMKNRIVVAAMAMAVAMASIGFAQTRGVDLHGVTLFEGRPFITDGGVYNGYDLGGSPLGLFDSEQSRMNVDLGYCYYGIGDKAGHYLSGQSLRMGAPGRSFFQVFYGPDILSYKNPANALDAAALTLQRFGLALAAQAPDGSFRTSLLADGYFGTQKWEHGDSSRAFMGFERLRLDFGSQVHPLVRLGLFFGATARLDTLRALVGHEDVAFQMNLPEFGGNIDFGGEDMPVRSNLYVSYAFSRYIYRTNAPYADGVPSVVKENQADAIRNDSLNIFWMAQGRIPVNGDYTVRPGLLFGYTGNYGEMRIPVGDNDNPVDLGEARKGSPYDMTGVWFGIGAGFEALKYADVHVEYTLAAMSVKWGEAGSSYPNYNPQFTGEKSRTLHNTAFGVSTPLHEYVALPLNITPRIAYFISGSAGIAGARHSSFEPMNVVSGKSKKYLYAPYSFLDGFERTSGFTFGVDGQALENRLSVSYWMTFLKNTVSKDGMEIGLSAGFSL
jgi:hypothetical protein